MSCFVFNITYKYKKIKKIKKIGTDFQTRSKLLTHKNGFLSFPYFFYYQKKKFCAERGWRGAQRGNAQPSVSAVKNWDKFSNLKPSHKFSTGKKWNIYIPHKKKIYISHQMTWPPVVPFLCSSGHKKKILYFTPNDLTSSRPLFMLKWTRMVDFYGIVYNWVS
jgi:hypothetical protein